MEPLDQDDVVRRLRSLGSQPVEPGVADRHASYLAAAAPVPARRRRRPAITAAFVAGVILGGTGLAAAVPGPLPTQAASVASKALKAVNPVGDERSAAKVAEKAQAKAARAAAKAAKSTNGHGVERYYGTPADPCPGLAPPYNHGQYVKAHPDNRDTPANERQLAAESDCGKPLHSVGEDDSTDAEKAPKAPKAEKADDEANETEGRPASPGKSEDEHPPATAVKEQGSENRTTDPGNSGDAGKADENRPEDVGPPTSTGS